MNIAQFDAEDVRKAIPFGQYFAGYLDDLRFTGRPNVMCLCPFHPDGDPSLSVNVETGDWRCHGCGAKGDVFAFEMKKTNCTFPEAVERLGQHYAASPNANTRQEVATYDYTDEDGALLFQVVRYKPKEFRQRRPDGKGGWIYNLNGVRRVPYKLPELLATVRERGTVYVTEGEKDADTLRKSEHNDGQVFTATCNPMGAGKWNSEFNPLFSGTPVVITADNDRPGVEHARLVYRNLQPVAASIRIVKAAQGKDVTDHINAGLGPEALIDATDEIMACPNDGDQHGPRIRACTIAEMFELALPSPDPIFFGVGHPEKTLIVGEPGASKTLLLETLALQLAAGAPLLGHWATAPRRVLLQLEEDGLRTTRSRMARLMAGMGITPGQVSDRLRIIARSGFYATDERLVDEMAAVLDEHRPEIWILDSITQCSGIVKQADAAEVRSFFRDRIDPLIELRGISFWPVHHVNKGVYSKAPLTEDAGLVSGSIQFNASVDNVLLLRKDKKQRDVRVVSQTKRRDGDEPAPFAFEIRDDVFGERVDGRMPLSLIYRGELSPSELAAAVESERVYDKVKTLLEDNSNRRFTARQVESAVGAKSRSVCEALRKLEDEGFAEATGGTRGVPKEYWRPERSST